MVYLHHFMTLLDLEQQSIVSYVCPTSDKIYTDIFPNVYQETC